ncbi:MAG TPA: SMC-Scp complex subunit ScpB [Pirellulales bacterium]|nr:SMC-Scp complex subunit ScpB [Pirellulales bacterium]
MSPIQNPKSKIQNPPAPLPPAGLGLDTFRRQPVEVGLSLDDLSAAFAEMLSAGHDPYASPAPALEASDTPGSPATDATEGAGPVNGPAEPPNDAGDVTPRGILEAMLFVGSPDNQPLAVERIAGLMRGVRPAEIDELVRELNEQYAASACPYEIKGEGAGYRMTLREEYARVRDKFHGRVRQARLSPAAVEVLSIVAYNGPQTADDVARLRGTSSGAILSQLVRRQLLALERPEATPRQVRYHTTQRFLDLFGLQSLDDLPRSQEIDRQ